MLSTDKRIDIIDGFRAMAVIAVVMYHYYFRFGVKPDVYEYAPISLFAYGYYGVQFFFIISGFVIYRSLEQSTVARNFILKRYFRLLPAMVICSVITFVFCNYLNDFPKLSFLDSQSPLNFLFSFTFISPDIWRLVLSNPGIHYIDGAYWSLWAEVVFYISACIIFFIGGEKKFFRNWLIIVIALQLSRIATSPRLEAFTPESLHELAALYYKIFLFLNFNQWMYFTAGIVFYRIWSGRKLNSPEWIIAIVLLLLEVFFLGGTILRLLFVILIALWIVFLKRPQWLAFFNCRPIAVVGLISYPLYLLHQNAGLITIAWITSFHIIPNALVPVVVLVIFVLLSYFVFTWLETPTTKFLKSKFLRSQKSTDVNKHAAHT